MRGGRVIQGFFIGGRPRPVAATMRAPIQRSAPGDARAPGPPAPAFGGARQVAQPHGGNGNFEIDPVQVGLARGGGSPLPKSVLAKMEAAFGTDFSGVRVHVGPQAARIGAVAFTMGDNLYFAPGQFQPDTVKGQQLIGHELAHVVQQRQGRVRAPGSGVAVVQDRMLEAEADRLGMQAAAHRGPVQAKMAGGAARVHITDPNATRPGSYRVTAGAMGSLMVHTRQGGAAEVTDLSVGAHFRDQGIGRELLRSAARTGLRAGSSKVSLSAQDNGSGRLTRWYKDMGFQQVGVNSRGFPMLEAPISRLLASPVQRRMAGGTIDTPPFGRSHFVQRSAAATSSTDTTPVTRCGAPITNLKAGTHKNKGPLTTYLGKTAFSPKGKSHTEEQICDLIKSAYKAIPKPKKNQEPQSLAPVAIEMNAWPCGDCDALLQQTATNCEVTITLSVTGDNSGCSADHKVSAGSTGTITYK